MVTGDRAVAAAAVAGQLGIDGTVFTGAVVVVLPDDQAPSVTKVRLVDLLQPGGGGGGIRSS